MKITPTNDSVRAILDNPSEGCAYLFFETYFSEKAPRVIEFPKVWRVDGKQYKVRECAYRRWGDARYQKAPTIRIPKGVYFCDVDGDCNVEEY